MLNFLSQSFPGPGLCASSGGRSEVPLKQGRSLMDWIRLTESGKDLRGLKGRLVDVTEEELKKHNKKDNCWMCIRGYVYNVSPYVEYHAGGEEELMRATGAHGTELFLQVHRWVNYESMLKECLVRRMAVKPTALKDYREERRVLNELHEKRGSRRCEAQAQVSPLATFSTFACFMSVIDP